MPPTSKTAPAQFHIPTVGREVSKIDVTIGPQFLNLFSEHLYSSPNKAFEELVSNSWDAGASVVHIGIPDDLDEPSAAVWVLDNGQSMDIEGLQQLWRVGNSTKRDKPAGNARPQIGKFGIGKLATYILGNELTYVCKAKDGVIRAITMDYTRIDTAAQKSELHINPLPIIVRELPRTQLKELLSPLGIFKKVESIIKKGVTRPAGLEGWLDEFAHPDASKPAPTGTWTLVVVTALKDAGQRMQAGWIRRLLRGSLPLSSSITIVFNDEVLTPLRSETKIAANWRMGVGLDIPSIEVPKGNDEFETVIVKEYGQPYPHITIDGIPEIITGNVYLYDEKFPVEKARRSVLQTASL